MADFFATVETNGLQMQFRMQGQTDEIHAFPACGILFSVESFGLPLRAKTRSTPPTEALHGEK